jgi:hypothetical protein
MGIDGPKERATFSIDAAVKQTLEESVPKSQRSAFVERAISEALRSQAANRVLKTIDEMPKARHPDSVVDFIRRHRMLADARGIEVLEGRAEWSSTRR